MLAVNDLRFLLPIPDGPATASGDAEEPGTAVCDVDWPRIAGRVVEEPMIAGCVVEGARYNCLTGNNHLSSRFFHGGNCNFHFISPQ